MDEAVDPCELLGISYDKFIEMSVDYTPREKEDLSLREMIANIAEDYNKNSVKPNNNGEETDDDELFMLFITGGFDGIGKMLVDYLEGDAPGTTDGHVAKDMITWARSAMFFEIAKHQTEFSRTGLPAVVVNELPIRLGLKCES